MNLRLDPIKIDSHFGKDLMYATVTSVGTFL
jgi:hypothetical protein